MNYQSNWLSTEDKILAMSESQLHSDIPVMMRDQGFTEDEIHRALQIAIEFRDQHKLPIID